MNELDAFRNVDFSWVMRLQDIWTDPAYDIPEVNAKIREHFLLILDTLTDGKANSAPIGEVMIGQGGSGKSHLLCWLRHEAVTIRNCAFVLVDMTDVKDFWDTVCLAYVKSLETPVAADRPQYRLLLERFVGHMSGISQGQMLADVVLKLAAKPTTDLRTDVNKLLHVLSKKSRIQTFSHSDTVRALIALNSDDFDTSSVAHTWLLGQRIEDDQKAALGFATAVQQPRKIVDGLSWLMSLCGPTVLAFDQLDPIVMELEIAAGDLATPAESDAVREARMIIQDIGNGLGALFDTTHWTLPIVSCLSNTWTRLKDLILAPALARYHDSLALKSIPGIAAKNLIVSRLNAAYTALNFAAPYTTWPFREGAFSELSGVQPREILMRCEAHRRNCLSLGKVIELASFSNDSPLKAEPLAKSVLEELDNAFEKSRGAANPSWILEERCEDERLAPLLIAGLGCLVRERVPIPQTSAVVESKFAGHKNTRPLHARLRLIHHDAGEREEHFCVRALQYTHHGAFRSRMAAAMTASGIGTSLPFRRLAIVRSTKLPGGETTKKIVDTFASAGGKFVDPCSDELRTLWAISQMEIIKAPHLDVWLQTRRPLSRLAIMQALAPPLCQVDMSSGNETSCVRSDPGRTHATDKSVHSVVSHQSVAEDKQPPKTSHQRPESLPQEQANAPSKIARPANIQLGRRWNAGTADLPVTIPVSLLEKHTVVVAGAGSGKTVLLKRVVEEAALAGVPSIVIDVAGDLATLGVPWPGPAPDRADDRAEEQAFFQGSDVICWTPLRETGNPLKFELFPDFQALRADADELQAAINETIDGLNALLGLKSTASDNKKKSVLRSATAYFADHGGGGLGLLVEVLRDLPHEARQNLTNEDKLAGDLADSLTAAQTNNPLLRASGPALNPAILLGDYRPRPNTRISIVSLFGLGGLDSKRQFLNQLALSMFSWIQKNPGLPAGRALRGLLVIDEAKDFIPSQGTTACKASLMRLVAQARKYHLGVVLATQNPKEIENTTVGNCSTQFYGKANSSAAIETVREQLRGRGADGADIGTLPKGRFYVYNADAGLKTATKLQTSMCFSFHGDAATHDDILARARRSREQLQTWGEIGQ